MPALTGEPWRGLAKVRLVNTLGDQSDWMVSITNVSPSVSGDQPDWEGTPGGSVTLRLEWEVNTVNAQEIRVRCYLPGTDTQVGSQWTLAPGGQTIGNTTRTFHFDDDPLDEIAGSARAGMLELWIEVHLDGATTDYTVDSRGNETVSPPAGWTYSWARGYVRSPVRAPVDPITISNASLGGAEPATFAYGDTTYNQVLLQEFFYRAESVTLQHRQNGANVRSFADTAQTEHLRSWTLSAADTERINNDYDSSEPLDPVDVRLVLPSTTFDADTEYVWEASPASPWTRIDDATIEDADRFTVDPRITFSHMMQHNDNVFGTPPTDKDDGTERLTSDLAFLTSRAVNARGEGTTLLTWDEKLWDNGELTGSEASPVATRSSTDTTQGGEAGWSDGFLTWDEGLPGGNWTQKQTITAPPDAIGLEVNNSRTIKLIGGDPRIQVDIDVTAIDQLGTHFIPGKRLYVGVALERGTTRISPDAAPTLGLKRIETSTRRLQHYNFTTEAWEYIAVDGTISTTSTSQSPNDSQVYDYTFPEAATAGWGGKDITVFIFATVNGSPYSFKVPVIVVDDKFRHDQAAPESDITFNDSGHDHTGGANGNVNVPTGEEVGL